MVSWLMTNGATVEPRASLWPVGTWLCYWVCAGIEVSSHDPLWNYTDKLSSHELFLGYLSLSCQNIFIRPDVVGELPFEDVQRITLKNRSLT